MSFCRLRPKSRRRPRRPEERLRIRQIRRKRKRRQRRPGAEDTTNPEETTEAPQPAETIDTMALMDILDKVYAACGKSIDGFYNTEVNAESLARYFGTDFDFTEAVASEYMIGGGYSFCLVRVDAGKTEEVAALIEAHADPRKWICRFAEEVTVAVNGNVVMLCMASKETCQEIETAFKNLK